MKLLFLLQLVSLSLSVSAKDIKLDNYDWVLNDIAKSGLTKEEIFQEMPRGMFANGAAICSNKAHVWSFHMKKNYQIDSAKVFLFFTSQFKRWGGWWYHVAPIINENGTEYVMDAGFKRIRRPLLVQEWITHWQKDFKCYEIQPHDRDLIELMHKGEIFPSETHRGKYSCYYIKTPAGYWWPKSIAKNLLGVDEFGEEVNFSRSELQLDEVYAACKEAVTGPLRSMLGWGDRKCSRLIGDYQQ